MSEHPSSDPEFYFRRVWDPAAPHPDDEVVVITEGGMVGVDRQIWVGRSRDMPEGVARDDAMHVPLSEGALVIYGRKIVSRYPEDADYIRRLEADGGIFTESFSVAAPTGEIGAQPLSEVTEITREEFEQARARGWQ